MTTSDEANLRQELAKANFKTALTERGLTPTLAAHIAEGAKYTVAAGAAGCIIEYGQLRSTDTPESLGALADTLVKGDPAEQDQAAAEAAGATAAKAAGLAAAAATKAQREMTNKLAFQ